MSWPTITANDVISGEGAKTFGSDLYSRDDVVAGMGWTWIGGPVTFTTSLIDEITSYARMPPWTLDGATITLTFLANQSGGAGNATFRLRAREIGGTYVNGTSLVTALTGTDAPYEVVLTVPASPSWSGELVELALQAQNPGGGGTWTVGLQHLMANLRVTPA